MTDDIVKLREQSVTEEPASKDDGGLFFGGGGPLDLYSFIGLTNHTHQFISPWGTLKRDGQLRAISHSLHNTLAQGVIGNVLIGKLLEAPYKLDGGRNQVRHWERVFKEAELGAGWDDFLSPFLWDYFTLDKGAYLEIIGPGDPETPLDARAMGFGHLDSLRCWDTGNDEHPVIYRSHKTNALHKIHWTRVYRMVHLRQPDPIYRGRGFSILSIAMGTIQALILMSKYNVQNLDDLPPAGILSISGLTQLQLKKAIDDYGRGEERVGNDVFRNIMRLTGLDPTNPINVSFTPFSTLGEGRNMREAIETEVKVLAVAFGVDPQDIFPLGGQLGTGTQTETLHAKGQGKTFGGTTKKLTRMFNISVLPDTMEYSMNPRDDEAEKAVTENDALIITQANEAANGRNVTQQEARQFIANNSERWRDVLTDENGELTVYDDDIETDEQAQGAQVDGDENLQSPGDAQADDTGQGTGTGGAPPQFKAMLRAERDIQATRLDFEDGFEAILQSVGNGSINRRRFGVIARGLISKSIRKAYLDGLEQSGVPGREMSVKEKRRVQKLIAEQSAFVTKAGARWFKDGITATEIANKPAQWWNKSIEHAYYEGLRSGDRNGMYRWVWDPQKDHCKDCIRLNGQVHRMKDWLRKGWIPKSSKLECKGHNCGCGFRKAKGQRAKGRF